MPGKIKKETGKESQRKGKKFENEVAEIFRLMGYKVQQNRKLHNDIDIYAELSQGFSTFRVIVECKNKNSDKGVEIADFNKFEGIFYRLRNENKADQGYFITKQPLSPDAQALADESPIITALTYDQLINKIIDFSGYLERVIYDYEHYEKYDPMKRRARQPIIEIMERANLYKYYVPLKFLLINDGTEKFDGKFTHSDDLFDYVIKWHDEADSTRLSILGDYGTGKSSFALQLTYELAKRYEANPIGNRIPVFVSLKDYAKDIDIESVITGLLMNRYGIKLAGFDAFRKMLELGKLLLIFDGFDEMADRSDKRTVQANFDALNSLLPSGSKSKLIVTCRTPYFKDYVEARDLFRHDVSHLLKTTTNLSEFEMLEVSEFNDGQIMEFIENHDKEKAKDYFDKIKETYNLEDLSKRPILLDMIIKTLPDLLKSNKEINTSVLYEEYVKFWIERDDWRSKMTPEGKAAFMETLSWLMYKKGGNYSIHYKELSKPIKEHFKGEITNQEELDNYDYDTRTCTFLNRDAEGNYKFIHKSFMEFFIARMLLKELESGKLVTFREFITTPEINLFVNHMEPDHRQLLELVKTAKAENRQGTNAANILLQRDSEAFKGEDLSGCNLRDVNFGDCDLSETILKDADLRSVRFENTVLLKSDCHGADLRGADFIVGSVFHSVDMSKDGSFLACSGRDKTIKLWNTTTGRLIQILKGHKDSVLSVSLSADGNLLVSSSMDKTIKLWDVKTGRLLQTVKNQNGWAWSVSLSADGKLFASGSMDKTIKLWDIKTGSPIQIFKGHSNDVRSVSLKTNKKLLVSSSDDKTIKLWDIKSGNLTQSLKGHNGWVRSISLSADGSLLASGSMDKTIKLWDIRSGRLLQTLTGHNDIVRSVSLSADGSLLASGSLDKTIKLWGIKSGRLLQTLTGHNAIVRSVSQNANRSLLASCSPDKTIKLWNIDQTSPAFGKLIRTITQKINCKGMKITDAKGLDTKGFFLTNKDGESEIEVTLRQWLIERGAIAYSLVDVERYLNFAYMEKIDIATFEYLKEKNYEDLREAILKIIGSNKPDIIRRNAVYVYKKCF